jgi:hypothetical protein
MARTIEKTAPRAEPPAIQAAAEAEAGAPSLDVAAAVVEQTASAAGLGSAPALTPPAEAVETAFTAEQGIAAWHSGVKITALWSNAAPRNAFAAVEGLGWRKVHNGSDGSFVTLTALLSHAKRSGSACNIRIEADNMIHEVYAW